MTKTPPRLAMKMTSKMAPLRRSRTPPQGHKLLTRKYDFYDDIMHDLHKFYAYAGFSVSIKRSLNPVKGCRKARFDLVCHKGKMWQSRNTSTMKRGCNWKGQVTAVLADNTKARKWIFEVRHGCTAHNDHEAEDRIAQRFGPEHVAFVAQYLDRPTIANREVARDLRLCFPSIVF
ncbi:hypothetical protein B0T26DRAFT_725783, partial [Lasiosphaeria miniovina]